jgi:tetratricopeptide (TPR) repeat protein
VEGIITKCSSVIRLARLIGERYNLANTTLNSITSECMVIEMALKRVKAMSASPHLTRLENSKDLHEGFNTALDGCSKTLQAVLDDMEKIGGSETGSIRDSGWKAAMSTMAKIKFIISDRRLKELLDQLRGQYHALQLLLQAYAVYVYSCSRLSVYLLILFSSESVQEFSVIMTTLRPTLKKIKENASTMRFSHTSSEHTLDRVSGRASRDYVQSILSYGELISEISSTHLTIDEGLINTNVYRRRLAAMSPREPGSSRDNATKPLPAAPDQNSLDGHSEANRSIKARSRPLSKLSVPYDDPFSTSPFDSKAHGRAPLNDAQPPSESLVDKQQLDESEGQEVPNFPPPGALEQSGNSILPLPQNTPENDVDIAEKSILVSSDARSATQRLKSLGSDSDFVLARSVLKRSRLDEETFVRILEEVQDLGSPNDYSKALKALESGGPANLRLTVKYLKSIRQFGGEADYPYALGVLKSYSYKFPRAQEVLESLKDITERQDSYSVAIQLLQHQKYNAASTRAKLQQLKDLVPDVDDYSCVLMLFQRNQFSVKRTLKVLDQMLSFTLHMAGDSWRKITDSASLHYSLKLLEKNDYGVEQTTNDLITLQEMGNDWKDFICLQKALKENEFDMDETIEDINWLNMIVTNRLPLTSVLVVNDYSLRTMRRVFDEISDIGGTNDFFWGMRALEKHRFNFKRTLDLLNRLRLLTTGPTDYSTILGLANHLSWREDRLGILVGDTKESSAKSLGLLRQNNAKDKVWFDGLTQLSRLNDKQCDDSLRSLVKLDYNVVVTLHFVDHVKDPMGCGGSRFSSSLSTFDTFKEGSASDKEEIVRIMNTLGLYEYNQEILASIFSDTSYNAVRMLDLLSKLIAINNTLNKAQRTVLWLLQYYSNFEDFMGLMDYLTQWTADEDRSIILGFIETLNGDYRRAEQHIAGMREFERESSLERQTVPNRALEALKRSGYNTDTALQEWRRMHAVNPRTTHWDSVVKVHERCLFDIETTIPLLERLNAEHNGDPFWYDVLVVHAAYIRLHSRIGSSVTGGTAGLRSNDTLRSISTLASFSTLRPSGSKPRDRASLFSIDTLLSKAETPPKVLPNANHIISHFQANYKYDGKEFRNRTMGTGSAHLASVAQDDKKGLYGRTHVSTTP